MQAKKHPLLGQLTASSSNRLPEVEEEILGHKYKLRLVKPEGEDWVAMQTEGSTLSAALLNARKPTLAAALVSIDDVPVEQLFELDDSVGVGQREQLLRDGKAMREWRREQVLDFLREEADPFLVDMLYAAYSKLVSQHKEAMRDVANLSKRTLSQA